MTTLEAAEPIPVHVKYDDTRKIAGAPAERVVTFKTFQSSTVPECILTQTAYRTGAHIAVLGTSPTNSNVALCNSQSSAQAPGSPQGMILPPGKDIPVYGTTPVWLVATGAGIAQLVSLEVETCQPN